MMKEVQKVQILLDLSSDDDDRFLEFVDVPLLSTNNRSVQNDLPEIKSEK